MPRPAQFSSKEIERATRVSRRTLVAWAKVGLIPKPAFRGPATRYSREHVLRILAVKKLRGDYYMVDEVRKWMAGASIQGIEALVSPLPAFLAPPPPAASEAAAAPSDERAPPPPSYPAERWERVVLLPGLELSVRDEPALRRIAEHIFQHYGSSR